MIECINIKKSFQQLQVLKNINFKVQEGQLISILGASGAGKSTLLHIIGTLDSADEGNILINGLNLKSKSANELALFRNQFIGFIFQFHHLLPEFSALENVCIPGLIANRKEAELNSAAKSLLSRLGLESRLSHKPGQLSGGEQQRVALARALINNPKILLADEPTGNLDQENAEQVLSLILSFKKEMGMTTIIVTHDQKIASKTDISVTMQDGMILNSQINNS
ncbi:MAG: ABC transporter ATP-binding protein [Saprospiraceae bacterium]|nr:ABC transporter ATP-binding protein [Saprospiraceae bacterium]MBK9221491.1 ABC transporter ATP-binding protein [Saprospiraceae bacterium]MBK9721571.1 ABC transporter ATP-binding protein [Saprospiraceae bacterium]